MTITAIVIQKQLNTVFLLLNYMFHILFNTLHLIVRAHILLLLPFFVLIVHDVQ
jgi:hypothetical protein